MNKISFLDELVKLGCCKHLLKRAESSSIPVGMASSEPAPESIDTHPSEANTRIPLTAHLRSPIRPGAIGRVTQAKDPIGKHRFNRPYGNEG
jgi:hypothetical protein